jgi:hypothetical protein
MISSGKMWAVAVKPNHKPGCTNKRRYATKQEALAAIKKLPPHFTGRHLYACMWCGGWHATSAHLPLADGETL